MFKRLFRSESGNIAVTAAIAAVPIMAGVVGAVDFVTINNKASEVQNALDASALAVATKYLEGIPDQQLDGIGKEHFLANIQPDEKLSANFALSNPTASEIGEDELPPPLVAKYFAASSHLTYEGMIASADLLQANRKSMVKVAQGQQACVLALNKSASASVKLQGSTKIDMAGCVLAANSRANDAVSRGGGASLRAECVSSSGGTIGIQSDSYVKLACGRALERQYPAIDPLADVPLPGISGCSYVTGNKKDLQLTAGKTYCDKSLTGNITLDPGTYVFRGTDIKLGGNGSLTGAGVTIFLLDGASINFSANEVVKLSPPETGAYAGITIYQASGNTQDLTMLGGAGTDIRGFIYAPSAHIQFAGNSDTNGTPECIRIIGDTIEMTGTSDIALDCEKQLGDRKIYASRYISLVR